MDFTLLKTIYKTVPCTMPHKQDNQLLFFFFQEH